MFEINKKSLHTIADAIIIILILVDTILLILISFYNLDPTVILYIVYFDLAVCVVLFFDFVYRLRKAENKREFMRKNWPDILAMIPIDFVAYNYAYLLRFIRIIRVIRILRLFALFNKSIKLILEFLKESHLQYSLAILIFTIFSGTIIFFILESPVNPKITTLWDSLWYVLPTIATVGSVDISPISPAGRLLSIFLMLIGLVLFGMVTASIASWYVELQARRGRKESNEKMSEIKTDIDELHDEISDLKNTMSNTGFTPENIVYTPKNILSFIAKLVTSWNPKKVLDPACGSGSFFWTINKFSNNNPTFKGIDIGSDIIKMTKDSLDKYKVDYELLNEDFLNIELKEQFDLIVSQPSFVQLKKSVLIDGFNFLNNEFAYLFSSLHLLEDNGYLVFILPEYKSFFYSDYHFPMREYLLKNYSVESIISLPNDTFHSESTLKTCLIIIKNTTQREKVYFAKYSKDNAKDILNNLRTNKNNSEGFWINSDLLAKPEVNWTYNYFNSINKLNYKKENSIYPIKKLEELLSFKEEKNTPNEILLLPINSYDDVIFLSDLEKESYDNYLSCTVIDKNVNPIYLKLYLNSESMKNERNLFLEDDIQLTMNQSSYENLVIEIPSLEIQTLIIETYNLSNEKYKDINYLYKNFESDILNYHNLLEFINEIEKKS